MLGVSKTTSQQYNLSFSLKKKIELVNLKELM